MPSQSLGTRLALATGAVAFAILLVGLALFWPMQAMLNEMGLFIIVLVTSGGAVLGVVVAVLLLARRMISAPLHDLAHSMGQAEEGDFLVRAKVARNDEIGALAKAFNKMLAALTDLRATGLEQELDLKQAQQQLELKQQIEEANAHLKRRLDELTLLMDLTRAVTSTLELRAVLDQITDRVGHAIEVDEFAIMLFDQGGRRLDVMSTYGMPKEVDTAQLSFAVGEGISGRVAQTGRALLVPDTSKDERYLHFKGLRPVDGAFLSVPMVAKGRVLGVLSFFRAQVNGFAEHTVALLTAVAGQAALAIENAQLFEAQAQLAMTDSLTLLLNRRALDQRLDEEMARAQKFAAPLAVLMVDVDHFKEFNDLHGHLLGDHVLRQVARTLKQGLRKVDALARYGGEEFCAVLSGSDRARAHEVAERLRAAVASRTFARMRQDRSLNITISIGVAVLNGGMAGGKALLDAADTALFEAKRDGRNRTVMFEPPPPEPTVRPAPDQPAQ